MLCQIESDVGVVWTEIALGARVIRSIRLISHALKRWLSLTLPHDTYQDYDPETLPWSTLSEADLLRSRGVLFWQEVYHTERRAGAIVDAFTPHVTDPMVQESIVLQGFEERRHTDLIRVMIERYGIEATAQPLETLPDDLETAFIDFGFGECLDSFLGLGAFKTARQSEFCRMGHSISSTASCRHQRSDVGRVAAPGRSL